MDAQKLARFRELLLKERERVAALIDETSEDAKAGHGDEPASSGVAGSQYDYGTDLYWRERALGLSMSYEARLQDIDDALGRINDGTYGVSERSGTPIDEARLEVRPWARLTVDEEREDERERQ